MPRAACLCLLLVALGHPALAQKWCESTPRDSVSYAQCALRVDGDYLIQGLYGQPVAMAESYGAVPLLSFVVGDSAIKYARLYERDATRSGNIMLVGDLLLLVGSVIAMHQTTYSALQRPRVRPTGPVLMLGGTSLHFLSYPLKWRALAEADTAVRWNNAPLRRER